MKIFISSDIEGTAGIADWGQVLTSGEYEMGRRLLLNEVNAAIDGAIAGGARSVVVNDSHWTMQNLAPADLHGRASYLSGRHKPLYMVEGLTAGHDAILMIGYHGSIGHERAVLSHTYNPRAVWEVRLNGEVTGESGLNALAALHHGVPIALVTGDEATAEETRRVAPDVEAVVVKRSVTRMAAESLHPEVARDLIREGARAAIGRLGGMGPPRIALPATLEVTFLTADMAEAAAFLHGVERTAARTISFSGDDPLHLYRTFVTIVALTRGLGE